MLNFLFGLGLTGAGSIGLVFGLFDKLMSLAMAGGGAYWVYDSFKLEYLQKIKDFLLKLFNRAKNIDLPDLKIPNILPDLSNESSESLRKKDDDSVAYLAQRMLILKNARGLALLKELDGILFDEHHKGNS